MKKSTFLIAAIVCMQAGLYGQVPESHESAVKIWQEAIAFPTYLVDPPDPNPRFTTGGLTREQKEGYTPTPSMKAFPIRGS